jgi:hypothetical protein
MAQLEEQSTHESQIAVAQKVTTLYQSGNGGESEV